MYKLQFKLKQHTPIIHFQHDQHGATLRASELKPKLDKFLIGKLGGVSKLRKENPNWFISKDHPALDYKVRVIGNIECNRLIPEGRHSQYGAFFGTIGEDYTKNPKGLTFTEKEIDLIITSFKDGLLRNIENIIEVFFEQNNFGTRQSKGFGSFTIIKQVINGEIFNTEFSNSGYISFFTLKLNKGDWFIKYKKASENMNLLYKAIRSGINLKNKDRSDRFYFKSLMFLYAKKKYNAQWEKKTIKENFFNHQLIKQKEIRPHSEPIHFSSNKELLFKDLLGLSSDESWYSYNATISKVQAKKRADEWIEENKDEIKFSRFKSPILFKPILNVDNNLSVFIFLDQNSLDEAIETNKDFIIRKNRDKIHLSFPDSFNLSDFFKFILDEKNFRIQNHVEGIFQSEQEYYILESIFNELKNHLKNLEE
jgi:hypothetical protein